MERSWNANLVEHWSQLVHKTQIIKFSYWPLLSGMPWMIRLGNIFLTSLVNLVMKETTCGSFWIVIGAHTRWQHITIKGISWILQLPPWSKLGNKVPWCCKINRSSLQGSMNGIQQQWLWIPHGTSGWNSSRDSTLSWESGLQSLRKKRRTSCGNAFKWHQHYRYLVFLSLNIQIHVANLNSVCVCDCNEIDFTNYKMIWQLHNWTDNEK